MEDRWRKYPDPAASRHIANEVHADAVAALEAAVVEAYAPVSHRYYRLKAKAMGRAVLDHWDRVGDWTQQWLNLRYITRLLARLGADDDALALHRCLVAAGKPSPSSLAESSSRTATMGR